MAREMSDWEKEVRKALIDRGMSVVDLAAELNISNAYLYDILSGARPAEEKKTQINKFLGIEV